MQVQDDESNFFYSEYKVILELDHNAHWMWDARKHYHGTTLSRLAAERPKSWKTFAKKNPDAGQWSRANVISHKTVNAMGKKAL